MKCGRLLCNSVSVAAPARTDTLKLVAAAVGAARAGCSVSLHPACPSVPPKTCETVSSIVPNCEPERVPAVGRAAAVRDGARSSGAPEHGARSAPAARRWEWGEGARLATALGPDSLILRLERVLTDMDIVVVVVLGGCLGCNAACKRHRSLRERKAEEVFACKSYMSIKPRHNDHSLSMLQS